MHVFLGNTKITLGLIFDDLRDLDEWQRGMLPVLRRKPMGEPLLVLVAQTTTLPAAD